MPEHSIQLKEKSKLHSTCSKILQYCTLRQVLWECIVRVLLGGGEHLGVDDKVCEGLLEETLGKILIEVQGITDHTH